jgi:hypothetical protein
MEQAEHVASTGKMRNAYNILMKSLQGRDHSEDLNVYIRIILKRIFGKTERTSAGFALLRIGSGGGLL